jgi:hypothetical protein
MDSARMYSSGGCEHRNALFRAHKQRRHPRRIENAQRMIAESENRVGARKNPPVPEMYAIKETDSKNSAGRFWRNCLFHSANPLSMDAYGGMPAISAKVSCSWV